MFQPITGKTRKQKTRRRSKNVVRLQKKLHNQLDNEYDYKRVYTQNTRENATRNEHDIVR